VRDSSATIEKYKIKGKVFATIDDIAKEYKVSHGTASKWITKRMTSSGDFIRTITIILDERGREIDPKDFAKTR